MYMGVQSSCTYTAQAPRNTGPPRGSGSALALLMTVAVMSCHAQGGAIGLLLGVLVYFGGFAISLPERISFSVAAWAAGPVVYVKLKNVFMNVFLFRVSSSLVPRSLSACPW